MKGMNCMLDICDMKTTTLLGELKTTTQTDQSSSGTLLITTINYCLPFLNNNRL